MPVSGVLQQLIAEQSYRTQGSNNTGVRDASRGSSPHTKAKNPPPSYPHTPPRRALSDESPADMTPQAHPFLNTSSRSAESTAPHFAANFSPAHPSPSRSTGNSGLLSKLRKEFSSKLIAAPMQVKSTHQQNITEVLSNDNMEGGSRTGAAVNLLSNNFPSPASSRQQLHGHPKSNSAGEEFLYTDRKAKLAASKLGRRRGKNPASVIRSRSLHYTEDTPVPHIIQRRPNTDLGLGSEAFSVLNAPRKRSDASTVSSSSATSDRASSSTGDGYFQISVNEDSNIPTEFAGNSSSISELGSAQPAYQHLTQLQSNMVKTPSGMGGLPQPNMPQGNPHGPYYATVPTNPIGHHSIPQRHSPPPPQTGASQRGPPPPYPQANGLGDDHHPQRPNSLSLSGQVSRKKIEYGGGHCNVGGLTSPAISTTANQIPNFNYPMSAGTPVHSNPFYTFTQEITEQATASGGNSVLQGYNASSQQPQHGQFKRSGSGNNFLAMASSQHVDPHTTMSSNSATAYQQVRYEQSRIHMTPQKQQTSTSPTYTQPGPDYQYQTGGGNPTSGFSLGKSDSNASTSSAGSRIARRNKRNSKNFSNTSGSSSSTGNSRPNSSADYLERTISENETLRSQLQSAEKKLKKYQNVEKELHRVTEDYSNLRISVDKTDTMQHTLISQLENENKTLRERVSTLTEMVETLQSSSKDAQSSSSGDIMTYKVKVQELEAKERQLIEQLDEAQDKISEQNEDISLLNSSLQRMQANAASFKEQLSERRKSEQYVEEISPLLDMLTKTLEARLNAESELNEIASVTQRQSTSSNDEGISEMDTMENALHAHSHSLSTQSTSSTLTRDEQLMRMQAQMLKWQHMYLQTALLRELSISEGTLQDSPRSNGPLYTMLYKHRHAASDPSYNKNLMLDLPILHNTELRALYRKGAELRWEQKRVDTKKQRRERTTSDQSRTSPRRRRRESPQDENEEKSQPHSVSDKKPESLDRDFSDSNSEKSDNNNNNKNKEGKINSGVNPDGQTEVDSPSEGYHSQQSSGSPTPSSERSSVHFPDGDSRVTAALGTLQDSQSSTQGNTTTTTTSRPQNASSGSFVVEV